MNFKKLLFLVLALITAFALIACGDDSNNDDNNDDQGNVDNTTYYTVTFAESSILQQKIASGAMATVPENPTKNGYTFSGWMLNNSAYDFATPVTADITLTPSWTATEYTITYMDGNNVLEVTPNKYTVESEDIFMPSPSKEHYNFMGWYKDADFTENIQKIAKGTYGDLTLYAQFTVKNYGITYELGGGINDDGNPASYNINSDFPIILANPTREGYNFVGWYTDANFQNAFNGIAELSGNVVVFAKWEEAEEIVPPDIDPDDPPIIVEREYTIVYMDGAIQLELEPEKYISGNVLPLPLTEKANYYFAGWFTTATFDEGTKIESITETTTGNLTLYAKFVPITYTITYVLEGGVNNEENPETYTVLDKDFNFKNPTKEGHKFAGWFTSPDYKTQISTLRGKAEDIVLYAKWEQESGSGIVTPEDTFN